VPALTCCTSSGKSGAAAPWGPGRGAARRRCCVGGPLRGLLPGIPGAVNPISSPNLLIVLVVISFAPFALLPV
jgi:hypothetical protein